MESFWLAITNLGRDEVFIVVLTLYTLLVHPRGGRDLGVAFALSYLINSALKYGLNLPRPFTEHPEVASEAARATAGGPGLPSGHAQLSATLWLGLAAQVRRYWFWAAALTLLALIAFSRLALHVHFPADVGVGLLLGGFFAWLGTRDLSPFWPAARWAVPLGLLAMMAAVPGETPREYSAGVGMLAGFWAGRPDFVPPRTLPGALLVGALGLLLAFGVYFGLGSLPADLRNLPLGRALRYALLVLTVLHLVPLLLRRWLPVAPAETVQVHT